MLRQMSSRTLTEWMAYSQMEPFGDALLDAHFSQLTAMVELVRNKKKTRLEPDKYRLWKKPGEKWNPQAFFDGLRDAFQFVKKD